MATNDKFRQPAEGIKIEKEVVLSEYDLEMARQRVAAGEDIDAVALELAIEETAVQEMQDDD